MSSQRRDYRLLTAVFSAAIIPLALLVDAAAAAMRGWRPVGAIEHAVLVVAAGALAAVLASSVMPAIRARLRRRWADVLVLSVACAAAWVLAEVGVVACGEAFQVRGLFHTRGPNLHKEFDPAPGLMPGVAGHAHYTTDITGLRTPGVAGEGFPCRVLCIGGSTTECVYLDDAKTWPAVLMQRLNAAYGTPRVWIGNAGFSGFATLDHLRFLQTSRLLKGIDCVIIQPGINDLCPVLAGEPLEIHVSHNVPAAGPRPLWAGSHVVQFWHDLRRTAPVGAGLETRDGSEYAARREKRRAAPVRDALPDLTGALDGYCDRLRALIDVARARSLPIVFTTQPVLWAAEMSETARALCWFGWLPDGAYLSTGALRQAMDEYNAALMAVCEETGTLCVDLGGMNAVEAYFYDDCHLTEAGAGEAAGLIAEAILSRPPSPKLAP